MSNVIGSPTATQSQWRLQYPDATFFGTSHNIGYEHSSTSTGWFDVGTGTPASVSPQNASAGDTVTWSENNTTSFTFTHPSGTFSPSVGDTIAITAGGGWNIGTGNVIYCVFVGASVGSSGGGTSTEGVQSTASGSLTHFGSNITWSIDSTSPSVSAADNYYLKLNDIIYYSYGITHTNGQHTTNTIPTQVGVWKLWHEDQNGGHLLDELTITLGDMSTPGKSSCNFW